MFRDVEGRTLQERLDELGMTGERYLALVGFYDGSGVSRCQGSRTLAVTGAGSRAVWICPRFAGEARQDPRLAEVSLLHEMLHSLGLGENPPSPAEITALVARHCGP
jgi:predicted Zn-dependent protease with MMP-like domain